MRISEKHSKNIFLFSWNVVQRMFSQSSTNNITNTFQEHCSKNIFTQGYENVF